MKLVTLHFDREENREFEEMTRTLVYSAEQVGINDITVLTLGNVKGKREHKFDNMLKFRSWVHYINRCEDGEEVMLIDSDTFIVNNPEHVFYMGFDLAITVRSKKQKVNTGVVFIRVSDKIKRFFNKWLEVQEQFYKDYSIGDVKETLGYEWYRSWAGINQAALMYCIQKGYSKEFGLELLMFPCKLYNACMEDWYAPAPKNRYIIHCNFGDLRHVIFGRKPNKTTNKRRKDRLYNVANVWKQLNEKAQSIDLTKYKYAITEETCDRSLVLEA